MRCIISSPVIGPNDTALLSGAHSRQWGSTTAHGISKLRPERLWCNHNGPASIFRMRRLSPTGWVAQGHTLGGDRGGKRAKTRLLVSCSCTSPSFGHHFVAVVFAFVSNQSHASGMKQVYKAEYIVLHSVRSLVVGFRGVRRCREPPRVNQGWRGLPLEGLGQKQLHSRTCGPQTKFMLRVDSETQRMFLLSKIIVDFDEFTKKSSQADRLSKRRAAFRASGK